MSACEKEARLAATSVQKPRSYRESDKSTRTVASMIETKKGILGNLMTSSAESSPKSIETKASPSPIKSNESSSNLTEPDLVTEEQNYISDENLSNENGFKKPSVNSMTRPKKWENKKIKNPSSPVQQKTKGKAGTKWEEDIDTKVLDYSEGSSMPVNDQNDLDKYASVKTKSITNKTYQINN